MQNKKNLAILFVSAIVMILIFVFTGNVLPNAGNPKSYKVVFFVS